MKNLLIFFLLFFLVLPTQVSASVCLNSHLAYQKEKVGKKSIKRILKQKMNLQKDCDFFWLMVIFSLCFVLGGLLGIILGLLFKGSLWAWILISGTIAGVLALMHAIILVTVKFKV